MPDSDPLDEATVAAGASPPEGVPVERTSPEPTGWTRRADFVCLSPKCQTPEGEALVYEDLRIDATHCPLGHKRLRRLFNKVGVIGTRSTRPDPDFRRTSNSRFQRSQPSLQEAFDRADKSKLQDKSMRSYEEHAAPPEVRAAIAASLGGQGGKGRPMTPAEIKARVARDPIGEPASIMARQWDRGIPTLVRSTTKDGTPA